MLDEIVSKYVVDFWSCLAPLQLKGEGIYPLYYVREVTGTKAYLSYDEETRYY